MHKVKRLLIWLCFHYLHSSTEIDDILTYHQSILRDNCNENITLHYYIVSKNDTDVAHNNFDADQPILIIFGRDFAAGVCYD